jgi:hypothetical protein
MAGKRKIDLNLVHQLAEYGLGLMKTGLALGFDSEEWAERLETEPKIKQYHDIGAAKGIRFVIEKLRENIENLDQRAIEYFLNNRDPDGWSKTTRSQLLEDGGITKIVTITETMDPDEAARKYAEPVK